MNKLAVTSLVASGIGAAVVALGLVITDPSGVAASVLSILEIVGAVVGIITGHIALRQIKRGQDYGRVLALAGTILGYVNVAFIILSLLAVLLRNISG